MTSIKNVNYETKSRLNKLLASENASLVIHPSLVEVEKGGDIRGFAFSVENKRNKISTYSYEVMPKNLSSCGGEINKKAVDSWILGKEGEFSISSKERLEPPLMVKFNVPENAPPCPIMLRLQIYEDGEPFESSQILLTIQ